MTPEPNTLAAQPAIAQFRVNACARRLEAAHALYVSDGLFCDAASVQRWKRAMQDAIRVRNLALSPADVARWERARGIS